MPPTDVIPREPVPERYIGDGVYASFDGFHIWLRTSTERIALEDSVYVALVEYAASIGWKLKS